MLAVLENGLRSYFSPKVRIRAEAERWVRTPQGRSPFSFTVVCETLGLEPEAVRIALRRLRANQTAARRATDQAQPTQRAPFRAHRVVGALRPAVLAMAPSPIQTSARACQGPFNGLLGLSLAHNSTRRRRSALLITDTELKLIAALAIIGLSSTPKTGYSTPAAIGTPSAL